MNVDLPPLSALTPDPAVARARTARDTLTLALRPEQGPVHVRHEFMSGNVSTGPSCAESTDSFRAVIDVPEEMVLTITF